MSPSLTFVCCIEYGQLEPKTLAMLRTLRRNGGALKDCPVIAVQGRQGVGLKAQTRQALHQFNVRFIYDDQFNQFSWLNYSNKVAAVKLVQHLAATDLICWLDSDILIAGEPNELLLTDEYDFAARGEYLAPAVKSGNSTHIAYWQAICASLGIDFDRIPEIHIDHQNVNIRMYFNSGVMVWRRSTDFADRYYDAFNTVMKQRIAQHDGTFYTTDQVILSPVVIAGGYRWKHLSYQTHHMTFDYQINGPIASPHMGKSALIHYSKSLQPEHQAAFLARLYTEVPHLRPDVEQYLAESATPGSQLDSTMADALRIYRGLRWRLFQKKVNRAGNLADGRPNSGGEQLPQA